MDDETRLRGWLDGARRGETVASAELAAAVRTLAARIARGGRGPAFDLVDWEDVAQEAILRLLSTSATYRASGSVRGYVYTTVKTSLLQGLRGARRRQRREQESARGSSITAGNTEFGSGDRRTEARRELEEILTTLGPECRALVEQVYLLGIPYARLAAEAGQAESSVRAKLSRCLRRARERAG